jgi:hypothetical protein
MLVLGALVQLSAAVRTDTATASVTIAALAKLSLSATAVTFLDASPDTVPSIPASGGAITITTKARTTPGSGVNLSVLASDDLRSVTSTIPVSAVTWTVTGTGFVAGTMSTTVAQSVASWVGSGSRAGTQLYALANSWIYATGSYSASFTYTLSAP